MLTATVSIGRNVKGEPMPEGEWERFIDDVGSTLGEGLEGTVHVWGARSVGVWDGVWEDSATFVAELTEEACMLLVALLDQLCVQYGQEAIALTLGATTLIGPGA